ncbi:MAG: DUF1554 domain-containing protein [Leptospira sp.]|nr:DUF1554 domain-containing protein [Leptospira sp.]
MTPIYLRFNTLKYRGILLLLSFSVLLYTGCKKSELNNVCDQKSKAYQDSLIAKAILGERTPLCGMGFYNYNSLSITSPVSGYTLKNSADTFTVKLSKQPDAIVIIPVVVSNTSQASVSPSSLSFTPGNWNSPQTVTMTGIDDLSYGVSGSFTIKLGPSVSSDYFANGLTWSSGTLQNRDFRKLIFISNSTLTGNTGGIPGADSICNSDSAKPVNTGTYKALIVNPAIRVASVTADIGDGQVDWVLLPNQLYTRTDGTVIMTTNSASIYVFGPNMTNAIGTTGAALWTGLNTDWTAAGGCVNWTDGTGGAFGRYGVANSSALAAINGGNIVCTNPSNLYCVQQ